MRSPACIARHGGSIPLGYHSDGGDITVINPTSTRVIAGRNLRGDLVNDNQVLKR
ncbi:MAG: hypothetical protein ABIS28_18785 [Caldimonas sp.]